MSLVRGVPGIDFGLEEVRGSFPEKLKIEPLSRPVDANLRVPGSKSITNRALVVAALANGASTIHNPLFSEDSYWLMDALVRLGFPVRAGREAGAITVEGQKGIIQRSNAEVFVGNAGTAARFLPPVLALGRGPYRVDGVERMRERPVEDLVEAMRSLGAGVEYGKQEGRLPLVVRGGGIEGGTVGVRGTESSQFLSGLLMAAPYAQNAVTLRVEGGVVSRPYVALTTGLMRCFGVEVGEGEEEFVVPQGIYAGRSYVVEPDASGASYFFAAAALTGGRVKIEGLGVGSSQGDLRFVEVLRRMGCKVKVAEGFVEVWGAEEGLRGVEADMNEISDTMMTLAAIAPFASTSTIITNVAHTRKQETDRISAVVAELKRLGIRVEERDDGLKVTPGRVKSGVLVRTYGDHRMAMAFSLVGLMVPNTHIEDPSCVAKTLPEYFELLRSL